MASLLSSTRRDNAPLLVDQSPCYLVASFGSDVRGLAAHTVAASQPPPATSSSSAAAEYKFGDISRGVAAGNFSAAFTAAKSAGAAIKDKAKSALTVEKTRPVMVPLDLAPAQQKGTLSGASLLNSAMATAGAQQSVSGASLLECMASSSNKANVDRTSFMCFSGSETGGVVAFGEPYVLRANANGGSFLRAEATADGGAQTRYEWDAHEASLGTAARLYPCSPAGKAAGTAVCQGDTVWLLTGNNMDHVLIFIQNESDGSLELVARPRSAVPQDQWAVLTVAPIQQEAAAKASSTTSGDASFFASILLATAAVTTATGTTNQVAAAAAPHVKKAAATRYSGPEAMSTMARDAQTAAAVGAAVANNPAARAIGSAMLSAAVDGAKKEGKSASGTSILAAAVQASTSASASSQRR